VIKAYFSSWLGSFPFRCCDHYRWNVRHYWSGRWNVALSCEARMKGEHCALNSKNLRNLPPKSAWLGVRMNRRRC
jgi:hypothetical protein